MSIYLATLLIFCAFLLGIVCCGLLCACRCSDDAALLEPAWRDLEAAQRKWRDEITVGAPAIPIKPRVHKG